MPNNSSRIGYEVKDANIRGILLFMCLVFIGCVLGFLAVRACFHAFEKRTQAEDRVLRQADVQPTIARSAPYFPYPREQPTPGEDLAAFRKQESIKLNTYGWVDRKSGVIRIPISRAMDLIVQRGLPTRGTTNQVTAGLSTLQLQQERPNTAVAIKPEIAQ